MCPLCAKLASSSHDGRGFGAPPLTPQKVASSRHGRRGDRLVLNALALNSNGVAAPHRETALPLDAVALRGRSGSEYCALGI